MRSRANRSVEGRGGPRPRLQRPDCVPGAMRKVSNSADKRNAPPPSLGGRENEPPRRAHFTPRQGGQLLLPVHDSGIVAACWIWGGSSAGRASRSQCEGREFDPPPLHQNSRRKSLGHTAVFQGFFVSTGLIARPPTCSSRGIESDARIKSRADPRPGRSSEAA